MESEEGQTHLTNLLLLLHKLKSLKWEVWEQGVPLPLQPPFP